MGIIDLNRAETYPAPYPMVIIRDSLPDDLYQSLEAEFPSDEEADTFPMVMGGRRRLASDEIEFYAFIARRPSWAALFRYVNSESFVTQALSLFRAEFARYGANSNIEFSFHPDIMLELAKVKARRFWARIRRKAHHLLSRFISTPEKDRIYVHFDISAAYDGYSREVHHDLDNRLIAFLIYFSDADETGGTGGEFGIHALNDASGGFPRQPPEDNTHIVDLLRPERNMLAMFLSTPDSYHSVPKVVGSVAARKFIYVGITVDKPTFWTQA